jgi:hypothetical protein
MGQKGDGMMPVPLVTQPPVPRRERRARFLGKPFVWTDQRRRALQGLGSGEPRPVVAAGVGCSLRSLCYWMEHEDFKLALQVVLAEQQQAVTEQAQAAVAEKHQEVTADMQAVAQWATLSRLRRIEHLASRHALLYQVIAERAAAYTGQAPGAGTGLLYPEPKLVKLMRDPEPAAATPAGEPVVQSAGRYVEVRTWRVDVNTLRELREIERQTAIELGDWTEKHEHAVDTSELDTYIEHELARLAESAKSGSAGAPYRAA